MGKKGLTIFRKYYQEHKEIIEKLKEAYIEDGENAYDPTDGL
jgi:hypothetical protein